MGISSVAVNIQYVHNTSVLMQFIPDIISGVSLITTCVYFHYTSFCTFFQYHFLMFTKSVDFFTEY